MDLFKLKKHISKATQRNLVENNNNVCKYTHYKYYWKRVIF